MFSREIIILLLLIKIIFVFLFYYSTVTSSFYNLFIKFFIFDSAVTVMLFVFYFESVISVEYAIIIFNFLFFIILFLQLANNELILYIYGINLHYSKKKYGIINFLFLIIKCLIYLHIVYRYFSSNYFLIVSGFSLLLYYFFFTIQFKNLIAIWLKYRKFSKISLNYNILFYFHLFNNYIIVPCFLLYELVLIKNIDFFIYNEKIIFIRDIIIFLFIINVFYYIIMYFMWLVFNKSNFIKYDKGGDVEIYLSISDITKIYSYQNSLDELSQYFLIKNINIIMNEWGGHVEIYDFVEQNEDFLFLGETLDRNQTYYYSYVELLQVSLFEHLYSFYEIKSLKDILLIMEKYNIAMFYRYFTLKKNKQYIILYYNNNIFKKPISSDIFTKIHDLIEYINNFSREFLDYFYYGNIFYNQYVVDRGMKENKKNFDLYYNYVVNNMNLIKYVSTFYNFNIDSDKNNLSHNNVSENILQYIDDRIILLKAKNGLFEYYNNLVLKENYVCEIAVKRKKEVYYAACFLPVSLVDADYAYNFTFYNILISLFGNVNILQKGDIDFFLNLVSGFKCKIIFTEHIDSFIFFPFVEFLLKKIDYVVVYFNFELDDVALFFDLHFLAFLTKKVVIISYGVHKNNLKKQDFFYKKYCDFIVKEESQIKWYIFSNQNSLDVFSSLIISIVEAVFYKNFFNHIEEVFIKSIIETFSFIINKQVCLESEKKYFESIFFNSCYNKNTDIYTIFNNYYIIYQHYQEDKYLLQNNYYLKEAQLLQKKSLENTTLMEKLLLIYKQNYSKIAEIIGVHRSTISRYFKNKIKK